MIQTRATQHEETEDFFHAQARLFWLLGDSVRLRILSLLAQQPGQLSVEELVKAIGSLTQPTISHHLHLLYQGGLLSREDRGVYKYYQIRPRTLDQLRGMLNQIDRA